MNAECLARVRVVRPGIAPAPARARGNDAQLVARYIDQGVWPGFAQVVRQRVRRKRSRRPPVVALPRNLTGACPLQQVRHISARPPGRLEYPRAPARQTAREHGVAIPA